jgi:hypothetical protein
MMLGGGGYVKIKIKIIRYNKYIYEYSYTK